MKAVVFSYTRKGAKLSLKVGSTLTSLGYSTECFTISKFVNESPILKESANFTKSAEAAFSNNEVIVYIGATGIAIRAVAPYVKNKLYDPAVISIDESGNFVIPLLSGHIGGANTIAKKIAKAIFATPVVTTATDVNGLIAIDEWAARNDIYISNMSVAKEFASRIIDGDFVGVKSKFKLEGKLPKGLRDSLDTEVGLVLDSNEDDKPYRITLNLIPRIYVLGIGCRRDTPLEKIEALVLTKLKEMKISLKAVKLICSVDLKANEKGLLAFGEKNNIFEHFYTAQELSNVPGEFTSSKLVQRVVGVDNVCERAAVLGSNNGELILKKTPLNGVTLAIAKINKTFDFNKY
jgi:cobalt-precorrin 5A hydrolase